MTKRYITLVALVVVLSSKRKELSKNFLCIVLAMTGEAQKATGVKEGKKVLTKQQEDRIKSKRALESCLTLVRSLYSREEVCLVTPILIPISCRKTFRKSSWSIPLNRRRD